MPLQYDPEYLKVWEPFIPLFANRPKLVIEEIPESRASREVGITALLDKIPTPTDVESTVYHAVASDGYQIPVTAFKKKDPASGPGPAIMHFHGGGMITGSAKLFGKFSSRLVSETSVPIFSVDYRLAPEHKDTTLVEDCYAALTWLHQNAQEHGVDPARIAVYGESAGGGIAAGVALIARDRNLQPPLAKQILVYPMLDDRNNIPNEAMEPFAFWNTETNVTAWTALLGDKAGKPDADVSPYAAPARAKSLAGLPPTYIDVGGLDIFLNENIAYATRLLAENITTELHVYPGVPHAFELIGPDLKVTKMANEHRVNAMRSL